MKNRLLRKVSTSFIIIFFGITGIVSSDVIILNNNPHEYSERIIPLNTPEAFFICDLYSNKLWKCTNHGNVLLGEAPGTNGLAGSTWISENDYPWWAAEFCSENSGSAIWKINAEGDYDLVTEDCGASIYGLEYNPTNGQLYGCDTDALYTIDMVTGNASLVGLMPGYLFCGLGIDNQGQGYSIDTITDCLYMINLSDSSVDLIGSTGQDMNYFWDCAFNYEIDSDTLYVIAYTTQQFLFICDTDTGLLALTGIIGEFEYISSFTISYGNQHPVTNFTWTPIDPYINETVILNASESFDPDGYITFYDWDWDNDGDYDDNTTIPLISHIWFNPGEFYIKLRVCDDLDGYTIKTKTITIYPNNSPSIPVINGPMVGGPGDYLTYAFVTEDPEGDDIFYEINWGDGTFKDWFGPFKSNEVVIETHQWNLKGTFTIKARAKDFNNEISGWGILNVIIPRKKILTNIFLYRYLHNNPNLFLIFQNLLKKIAL